MDTQGYRIKPTKHFALGWMRKWDYDPSTLRNALETAYKTEKVGKQKYEVYIRVKGKSRKVICAKNEEYKEIVIITGAEGT